MRKLTLGVSFKDNRAPLYTKVWTATRGTELSCFSTFNVHVITLSINTLSQSDYILFIYIKPIHQNDLATHHHKKNRVSCCHHKEVRWHKYSRQQRKKCHVSVCWLKSKAKKPAFVCGESVWCRTWHTLSLSPSQWETQPANWRLLGLCFVFGCLTANADLMLAVDRWPAL